MNHKPRKTQEETEMKKRSRVRECLVFFLYFHTHFLFFTAEKHEREVEKKCLSHKKSRRIPGEEQLIKVIKSSERSYKKRKKK